MRAYTCPEVKLNDLQQDIFRPLSTFLSLIDFCLTQFALEDWVIKLDDLQQTSSASLHFFCC